jgi:uncharacterized membrane protein YagU involved in acid resistance
VTQSRLWSLIEAWTNTLVGYLINVGIGVVVFPLFGATFTLAQNFSIGLIFVAVSVVRGYLIRRLFNRALN